MRGQKGRRRRRAPPSAKGLKTGGVIMFDEEARTEYLTGFHKRKLQRRAEAMKQANEKARKQRIADRATRRELEEEVYQEALQKLRSVPGEGEDSSGDETESEEDESSTENIESKAKDGLYHPVEFDDTTAPSLKKKESESQVIKKKKSVSEMASAATDSIFAPLPDLESSGDEEDTREGELDPHQKKKKEFSVSDDKAESSMQLDLRHHRIHVTVTPLDSGTDRVVQEQKTQMEKRKVTTHQGSTVSKKSSSSVKRKLLLQNKKKKTKRRKLPGTTGGRRLGKRATARKGRGGRIRS